MVTAWVPSLGVLAASTVGKVLPPSVDRQDAHVGRATGAAGVLATFQVTVCVRAARPSSRPCWAR